MPGTFGPSAANQMATAKLPIEQAKSVNQDLSQIRPIVPSSLSNADKNNFLSQLRDAFDQTVQIARDNEGEVTSVQNDISSDNSQSVMASSYFDLSKFSQMAPVMDSGFSSQEQSPSDPMMGEQDSQQSFNFNSPQELQALLEQSSQDPNIVNQIVEASPADAQDLVKDSLQRFFEPGDAADKTILAAEIFKAIHGRGQGEEQVEGTYTSDITQASVENVINNVNKAIKVFAKHIASMKKTSKSYNLKKQAQQFNGGSYTDFINYGPDEKRVLPYSNTGIVGNDWHVWLRGRDHNFIFDDHAVDFDTFWRGNIMDKYSQPYRNNKGEWVGGYLNKRFETDHNIPEGNNLQLLPGQRRRPYLPEFASMEARMEASRSKFAEDRGYDPSDTDSKAYNWKEAGTVKKKVISQGLGEIPKIAPLDKPKPLGGEKQCAVCLSDNKATATACVNCGASLQGIPSKIKPPQRDQKGPQNQQNTKEKVFMGMPVTPMGIPGVPLARAAQSQPFPKTIPNVIKPIKPKRKISDDDVSVVDENHLSNVEHSADHLGL